MVAQWRFTARCALRDLAGDRDSLEFQSTATTVDGWASTACEALRKAGCRLVYLDGSFVTRKEHPGDFDACWDVGDVDDNKLDPVFWDFSQARAAQKQRFGGEFFPAQLPEGATGNAFVEFFRINKLTGEPKGILAVRLRGRKKR
jgi:hypothetical protein